jgi:hypothetical protein
MTQKSRKALGAAAVVALLAVGGAQAAEAKGGGPHKAHCKVTSTSTEQTRDVTGVDQGGTYGTGIQHRTQTTTSTRCRGKVTTVVTYTPWTY